MFTDCTVQCHGRLCKTMEQLPVDHTFWWPILRKKFHEIFTLVWEAISKTRASGFIRRSKHLETIKALGRSGLVLSSVSRCLEPLINVDILHECLPAACLETSLVETYNDHDFNRIIFLASLNLIWRYRVPYLLEYVPPPNKRQCGGYSSISIRW